MIVTLLWVLVPLVLIVVAAAAYVGLKAGRDLEVAQQTLSDSPGRLKAAQLVAAGRHLRDAERRLESFPATLLRYLPVAGPNIDALRATADASSRLVGATLLLQQRVQTALDRGLISAEQVDLNALESLRGPVRGEAQGLHRLDAVIREHTTGWLLPPLYDRFVDLGNRIDALSATAAKARRLLNVAPRMLGDEGTRTYLILLLNNAELRGAGGIASGVGTVTLNDGHVHLGRFQHYTELRKRVPVRSVKAPADFERRFARFNADTTGWVNVSASPQTPEVAVVARRLYKVTAGRLVDGVILIDARGLQALLPPHSQIPVPTGGSISARGLPRYVYSGVYKQDNASQTARRQALIDVGRNAFDRATRHGLFGSQTPARLAVAVASGHLRVVSFHSEEEAALSRAGLTGRVDSSASDTVLVTVQNFGGDKLDFWMKRHLDHRCNVTASGALCETKVRLHNAAPDGLPSYVLNGRPAPISMSEVDIYVPGDAHSVAVTRGGRPTRFFSERDFGLRMFGANVKVAQGVTETIDVRYRIPLPSSGYSLTVLPQPLAHDAHLSVALGLPTSWSLHEGPGRVEDSILHYKDSLRGPVDWDIGRSGAPGLTGMWRSLIRFWENPI